LRGETVFLLGGGPSMTRQVADRLRGHPAVAINSSLLLAPWAPFLFFTDHPWLVAHRRAVEAYEGIAITMSRGAKAEMPGLRRLGAIHKPDFDRATQQLRCGRSSGHTAVSLAIAMDAARIVLVGYDCRVINGRSHHLAYNHYEDEALYSADLIPAWKGWNAAAERAGVEVLNATPGSALDEFPLVDLERFIDG
jgi:hypothetical protein